LRRKRINTVNMESIIRFLVDTFCGSSPSQCFSAEGCRGVIKVRCVEERGVETCIVGYVRGEVLDSETFLRCPIAAVARGTVVRIHRDGSVELLAYPFPKFFNLGEVGIAELRDDEVVRGVVTEKLDGALIVCWWDDVLGRVRCNTRNMLDVHTPAGYDVALGVNPIVKAFMDSVERLGLLSDLRNLVEGGYTAMFELVGDRPMSFCGGEYMECLGASPMPYLLAVRETGRRIGPIEYVNDSPFPTPRRFTYSNVAELVETVREWDAEGVVVHVPHRRYMGQWWWDFLVKVKSPKYLAKAYIASMSRTHRTILQLISDKPEIADDVLASTSDEAIREIIALATKIAQLAPNTAKNCRPRILAAADTPSTALRILAEKVPRDREQAKQYLLNLLSKIEKCRGAKT